MADIDPLNLDFATKYPDSFARTLGRGDAGESSIILEKLPPPIKAAIIARLPAARIEQLLASGRHNPAEWLVAAPFDDALTLLSRIPQERRLAVVNSLDNRERRQRLLRYQQYPSHCAGSLTSDIHMRFSADAMAADVLTELRNLQGEDPGPLVVIDTNGCYTGVVDRWRLLMADPPVGRVQDYTIDVNPIRPETPIVSAAKNEDWHTRNWLPIVDHRNRVLGGVARATLFRAAAQQAGQKRDVSELFVDLAADLVHVLGSLLERLLGQRKTP